MVLGKINTHLVPMKAHYFLYNAGTAPVVPFLPTFARQLGFSAVAVGTLYTALPVAGMLAKPACGAIADRLHLHKSFFLAAIAITAVAFLATGFIPESSTPPLTAAHLDCGSLTNLKVCGRNAHCATSRLLSDNGNETVTCHVFCNPSDESENWGELCQTWNITRYCSNVGDQSNLLDNLFERKSMDSSPKMISHLNQKNFTNHLEFLAEVPIIHSVQVDSCLFLRVSEAVFPDGLHVPYCNSIISAKCKISCDNEEVSEAISEIQQEDSGNSGSWTPSESYQFWLFSALLLISWVGMAVTVSIGDAICFEMLGDKPQDYGRQRLWGAFGWGIFSALAGFLVDQSSKGHTQKDYSPVFYLSLGLLVLDFLNSTKLKHSEKKMSASIVRDVGRLFLEFRVILFLVWCVAIGLCTGVLWQFLFWHLEDLASKQDNCDVINNIKTIEGLVMAVQCFLGEIPFFFLSGIILKKLGHVNTMTLVLFGFGVRMLLYSFLTNPWWALPIELLNGLTFGLAYATMASYASVVAPPGTEATVQGLVGATFEGIGVSLGSLMGGVLFSHYGGTITFRIYGIGAFIVFILHGVLNFCCFRCSNSQHLIEFQKAGVDDKEEIEGDHI